MLNVLFSNDHKTATVVAADGTGLTVAAHTTLAVWHRKDGGVTLRTDFGPRAETVRVNSSGRIVNGYKAASGR